ncbi:MAG: DUF4388 domain-containing protein [Waterburya sp.]
MTISGSLETFSLPELFQIIQSGNKSGRLSFNPGLKNADPELKGTFELWFQRGNFVAIINSLKYQSLIAEIQNNNWLSSKLLVQTKYSCPPNQALGEYIQQKKILTSSQIDLLFQSQLDAASKLFDVSFAWFKFEEIDSSNQIPSDGEQFPWKEMTGKHKQATEILLESMRQFSDWSRFAEEMPAAESSLQKLVSEHDLHLNYLESHLWNTANSSTSLKEISQKMEVGLETIQQTALALIFAGLVEETPIISTVVKTKNVPNFATQTALIGENNIQTTSKSKASNSLINNLVSFLRNNF